MTLDELLESVGQEAVDAVNALMQTEPNTCTTESIGFATFEPFDEVFRPNNEVWDNGVYRVTRVWNYNDSTSFSRYLLSLNIEVL